MKPEDIGVIPVVPPINEKNELGSVIGGFLELMPQPELIKAVGVFVPRLFKKKPKLTKEMVPKDSILYSQFQDEDATEVSKIEEIK